MTERILRPKSEPRDLDKFPTDAVVIKDLGKPPRIVPLNKLGPD